MDIYVFFSPSERYLGQDYTSFLFFFFYLLFFFFQLYGYLTTPHFFTCVHVDTYYSKNKEWQSMASSIYLYTYVLMYVLPW